jgi:ferredoxin
VVRKIIKIDEDKCNGCGLCVTACHEGAIALVDGKAKLMRDDYCDGLGNCLPVCPVAAISFEEREAGVFDENAVKANMENKGGAECGCPGTKAKLIRPMPKAAKGLDDNQEPLACGCPGTESKLITRAAAGLVQPPATESQLSQWPVQIKLVPVNASYFENSNLLVAADCSAYAYGGFHERFIKNRVTLIGCPKLDDNDYPEKLTEILKQNNIKSVTVVRMEVPCCGGIENAVRTALQNCGKLIPWQIVTISTDGKVLED